MKSENICEYIFLSWVYREEGLFRQIDPAHINYAFS